MSQKTSMKKYFGIIRNMHLYAGLFLSPFLILFSMSALILNHDFINWQEDWQKWTFSVDDIVDETVKFDLPGKGMTEIDYAKEILKQLNIKGEISNIFGDSATMYIPVTKPGSRISIKADLASGIAYVHNQKTNFWKKLIWMHKMPGPHNANIRGNWMFVNFWSSVVDFSVICLFLSSITGVVLWYYLKNERTAGLLALLIGFLSMVSLVVALIT